MFKLKHVKQLIQAVDALNLQYGVINQMIRRSNLLIDESVDEIRLIDFHHAIPMRAVEEYERHDVGRTVFTVYEIIT